MRRKTPLTFHAFSRENKRRCTSPKGFAHAIESWDASDWMVAVLGELGEAANLIKKLNRERDGVRGNVETPTLLKVKLRGELSDAVIYLDLLFQYLGEDMAAALIATWDAKSKKIGYARSLAERFR